MRELLGLIWVFIALFLLLSLVTYDPADPTFNQVVSGQGNVINGAGLVGAYLGGLLVDLFGLGAFALPVAFGLAGIRTLFRLAPMAWWRWLGYWLAVGALTNWAASETLSTFSVGMVRGGGYLGTLTHTLSQYYLRTIGAGLFWTFLFLVGAQLASGSTLGTLLAAMLKRAVGLGEDALRKYGERAARKAKLKQEAARRRPEKKTSEGITPPEPRDEPEVRGAGYADADDEDVAADELPARFVAPQPGQPKSAPSAPKPASKPKPAVKPGKKGEGEPPDFDLLDTPVHSGKSTDEAMLADRAEKLTACLADFGVQGEITRITPGPVVTMFEYKPAPGIKISKIAGLADDLTLAMKARSVRIQPLAGKDTVGVEVPNEEREMVYLREVLEADSFKSSGSFLTMALGKDISGTPKAADLAKMPHLLVAGATGAGKSVCINAILVSFLYKAKPEELKLLLVDPKRIELSVYADLPHLVHPVVTEMNLAKNALDWAVAEMDRRYEAMARVGARNITTFNQKLKEQQERPIESWPDGPPDYLGELEVIPYLVIIIDELADLMLTAAKEVEQSIVRLAQLARAAGIHMILATQRPSVDVVTGLIKANFPCRIAFQVTSKHDSRTILDAVGAEHLLGRGDMLFKPSGARVERMHGAFVSDGEVQAVADFWRARQKPDYKLDFAEWGGEGGEDGAVDGVAGGLDNDQVYKEAVEFVLSQGKASISLLQRRFRIGFNRAARYVEQMEIDGIIGPADGSKPRLVIKHPDE